MAEKPKLIHGMPPALPKNKSVIIPALKNLAKAIFLKLPLLIVCGVIGGAIAAAGVSGVIGGGGYVLGQGLESVNGDDAFTFLPKKLRNSPRATTYRKKPTQA